MLRAVLFGLTIWTVVSVVTGLVVGRGLAWCGRYDAPETAPNRDQRDFRRAA